MSHLQIKTTPDFISRSKEQVVMTEDTRTDIIAKHSYIKNHLDNMTEYLATHKMHGKIEAYEYGCAAFRCDAKNRLMNGRKLSGIIAEIGLMSQEEKRLRMLINK